MTNEVATTEPKGLSVIGQICAAIEKMEPGLKKSLTPLGVDTDKFIRTAKIAIQSNKDRKGIESANRASLFMAIEKSAAEGLLPDGREAALIVYSENIGTREQPKWEKVVNYQPMVQGLVKLARKSGEILKISACIVHENDHFKFNPATMDMPDFDPDWFNGEKRGKPVGVWSMVKLTNGEVINEMLTEERIMRIASHSKIKKNYNVKEGVDWEEWWKKAAVRNILKYAPRSTDLEKAFEADNNEFDVDDINAVNDAPPVNPVNDKPKTDTKAAQSVRNRGARNKPKDDTPTPSEDEGQEIPTPEDDAIDGEFSDVGEDEEPPV